MSSSFPHSFNWRRFTKGTLYYSNALLSHNISHNQYLVVSDLLTYFIHNNDTLANAPITFTANLHTFTGEWSPCLEIWEECSDEWKHSQDCGIHPVMSFLFAFITNGEHSLVAFSTSYIPFHSLSVEWSPFFEILGERSDEQGHSLGFVTTLSIHYERRAFTGGIIYYLNLLSSPRH